MRSLKTLFGLLILLTAGSLFARADDVRFDLNGPTVNVTVTRAGRTLPIAQVPNLLPNDQLQLQTNLPLTQSNHLLLIVVFLRGTTNEPPDDWFTAVQTWKPAGQRPIRVTVPDGAQRVLLFVAPETGGDFDSLRSVVKNNPGLFLRASDSLFKASLEQQRIERYLSGMQAVAAEDETVVAARSAKLASALLLKPNADCFKQPVEDQVDCLTQASAPMLLDSGGNTSVSSAISTGASSDFINEASQNDGGVYSAYVGTIVDLVHLIGLMHTAQYRYIPALTLPNGATLNTRLNAPPSFSNPKSVIVIALPPIRPSRIPDLHLEHDNQIFCLRNPALVLPLRGSKALYSTTFAHDLYLDFGGPGRSVPLTLDVVAGGLLLDRSHLMPPPINQPNIPFLKATVRGKWGYDNFEGPTLTFQRVGGSDWKLVGAESLLARRKAQVQLQGNATACLRSVLLILPGKDAVSISATPATDSTPITLTLPLDKNEPGTYAVQLLQYGNTSPVTLPIHTYAESGAHVTAAYLSPDQQTITLLGTEATSIRTITVGNAIFHPVDTPSADNDVEFRIQAPVALHATEKATLQRNDGSTTEVALSTEQPGVMLHVLSLDAQAENVPGELSVQLRTGAAIPLHSTLRFVLSSDGRFTASDTVEIATAEGATTQLSFVPGSTGLVLEDLHTAIGTLDADHAFGESAFGALRLRLVRTNGEKGPWVPLGTLVRRPQLSAMHCIAGSCVLQGKDLFLIKQLSTSDDFSNAMEVSAVTAGDQLTFSAYSSHVHTLYLRLRDDETATAVVSLSSHSHQ